MVYLAKKGGEVVHHTSLPALREIDGIEEPDMAIPDAEFEAADGLARIINGEIFIGKTDAEITAEQNQKRIAEIDAELDVIDQKSIRPERAISHAMANGETPPPADVAKLDEFEARADALRQERTSLNPGVAG